MLVERTAAALLRERLKTYPAVILLGARQAGKTTLAKSLGGRYFDLEQPEDRLQLDLAWPELETARDLWILDAVQVFPEIFPRLRGAIDARRRVNGRFLLLGSVGPALMREVSESLAGRMSVVELAPFDVSELGPSRLDDLWLAGGFPDGGIRASGAFPDWQLDYLRLLTQRDLPNWGLPARPSVTLRLLRMIAALHGQCWNASQVGQSLGLNYQTINSYMEYIEGSFLVRRLDPFHANLAKRLVKRPKCYWRDSGLLHALLDVRTRAGLLAQPWAGASWEGFVIEQVLACLQARGLRATPFFLRTSDAYEIDLILQGAEAPWAIEIRLTTQPSEADLTRLNKTADLIGAGTRVLLSRTSKPAGTDHVLSTNLPGLLEHLTTRWLA
jgi:predicted AAA+ superfamily ATPase